MAPLKLEIVEGPDAGRDVVLGHTLHIGRDAGADLRLADKLVSRQHARIVVDAHGAVIEDLGSSNGTLVNDVEIGAPTRLSPGDRLLIGACVMHLSRVTEPAAKPAPVGDPQLTEEEPPTARHPPSEAERHGDHTRDPLVGSVFADYRIDAVVARGGMGVVYRAHHLRLERVVALKLLPPDLAGNAGFRERFECESRLAAAIDHPHIIPLYDAGTADGLLYLTMRFVDGQDLGELLRRSGPLDIERAISIVGQVGGALDAAHARGLVHRDVKPANVLVSSGAGAESTDHCYLTDFGLTRDTAAERRLTKPGEFVGTIDYAAPEQIRGQPAAGTADQYALGCLLYECLTGRPPFDHPTDLEIMRAHIDERPPAVSPKRDDVPKGIDGVIARALAKFPQERFSSCRELASAARAATQGRRRRRGR